MSIEKITEMLRANINSRRGMSNFVFVNMIFLERIILINQVEIIRMVKM